MCGLTSQTAFGESFECLTTSTLHTWIEIFFSLARFMSFHQVISRLPGPMRLPATLWTMPKTIASDVQTLKQLQSVSTGPSSPSHHDFWRQILIESRNRKR